MQKLRNLEANLHMYKRIRYNVIYYRPAYVWAAQTVYAHNVKQTNKNIMKEYVGNCFVQGRDCEGKLIFNASKKKASNLAVDMTHTDLIALHLVDPLSLNMQH